MATSTSTVPDRPKSEAQQEEMDKGARGMSLAAAVLWIAAATALWNVLLVLFHYVTDRLLGR